MDKGKTIGVKRNSKTELVRNSSIAVTIDDIAEGLLVVSFTHNDNLYQGVLFQLNRERGIPCGISFAKEQALGAASLEKAENDPTQALALHQRHTYSQGNNNGPTAIGSISQPLLRRIIKPPARFNNSRMSLRLRARPVLCAKCRSLCDDKTDGNSKEEPKGDNQTDKHKKDRPKLGKPDPTLPSLIGGVKANDSSLATPTSVDIVDSKDLCYTSVGSTRVVENYWKRPLIQPLIPSSEETYARLRKTKAPLDNRDKKRVKIAATTNHGHSAPATCTFIDCENNSDSVEKLSNSEISEGWLINNNRAANSELRISTESLPLPCDKNFPNTRSRKAQNLKMCITKLTDRRNESDGALSCSLGNKRANASRNNGERSNEKIDNSSNHSISSESTIVPSPQSVVVGQAKTESGRRSKGPTRKSKDWENRIRKKSTIPCRYRDESYLSKNIFNFNRRQPHETGGSGEIPVLTICRSEAANTFKVSTPTDQIDSTVTTTNGDDDSTQSSTPARTFASISSSSSPEQEDEPEPSNTHVGSSNPPSPSSSSNINEMQPNFSIKSSTSKSHELIKTPTIKITFGSSGNGMVVQIPPKVTQHLECSSTTEMKAARKAMKKAKKEARRKRSLSTEHSPSSNALSPIDPVIKSDLNNPNSPSFQANEESQSEIPKLECNDNDCEPLLIEANSSENVSAASRVTKKKKKQKKRRRNSKIFKENDGFTSSSSSHDHNGYSNGSPYSNSSMNQDCANHGHNSPGGSSVKSCNLDSISTPDAQDAFPSFCSDSCTQKRRRSVPASSTTSSSEVPRVGINLKRIDTNAYVPLPLYSLTSHADNEAPSPLGSNSADTDDSEPNEFPSNEISNENGSDVGSTVSVEEFKDKESEHTFQRGDVVWGKLPSCPWWPGKIVDIFTEKDEARAKISWYKSTTQSCVRFKMVLPFSEHFDNTYRRSRRRGLYQHAVRDAMMDADQMHPEDLSTD